MFASDSAHDEITDHIESPNFNANNGFAVHIFAVGLVVEYFN